VNTGDSINIETPYNGSRKHTYRRCSQFVSGENSRYTTAGTVVKLCPRRNSKEEGGGGIRLTNYG
jgi:hypothetical protein